MEVTLNGDDELALDFSGGRSALVVVVKVGLPWEHHAMNMAHGHKKSRRQRKKKSDTNTGIPRGHWRQKKLQVKVYYEMGECINCKSCEKISQTNCLHNEDIMIVVEMMHLGFNKQV